MSAVELGADGVVPEEQPLERQLPTVEEVAALAGAMGRYGLMPYLGVVLAFDGARSPGSASAGSTSRVDG